MSAARPVPDHVPVVARQIRLLMADRDMTLTRLAAELGMGQPSLTKRMDGEIAWTLTVLIAIADYFNVPLSTITPDTLTETRS